MLFRVGLRLFIGGADGALLDPAANQRDFVVMEGFAVAGRRHAASAVTGGEIIEDGTLARLAGHERGPALAADAQRRGRVHAQFRLLLEPAVAAIAAGEDRLHLLHVIHLRLRGEGRARRRETVPALANRRGRLAWWSS